MTYTQPTYPISFIDTEQKICKLVYKTLVKNKIPKSPNSIHNIYLLHKMYNTFIAHINIT